MALCVTVLLYHEFNRVYTHDWIVGLGCTNNMDVVYIDFNKAFDSIVFSNLLFKLQNCGISGKLHAWLSSFIDGTSHCVVLENCFSSVK